MARTREPPVNVLSKGAGSMKFLLLDPAASVWFFVSAVALTNGVAGDGAGWAGPGSLCLRTDVPGLYINTNTKLSPTWTQIS